MEKDYTPEEVAEEVGEGHNNTLIKQWTKLYAEAIQRAGFRIMKEVDE